jgi:hypothetical protein
VDQRQFATGVEVRMRIFVRHFAMRRPARVTDAERTRNRFLGHQFFQDRDAPGTFARLKFVTPVDYGQAGGVVAAIFKTAQSVE